MVPVSIFLNRITEEYKKLFGLNGLTPFEYFAYGLESRRLSFKEKAKFLSYFEYKNKYLPCLNPRSERSPYADKISLKKLFKKFNIPTARFLCMFSSQNGITSDGKEIKSKNELGNWLFRFSKKGIVIKPIFGGGGSNILVIPKISKENGRICFYSYTKKYDIKEIYKYLFMGNRYNIPGQYSHFAEEKISQHSLLNEIYPKCVHTVKIWTLKIPRKGPLIFAAVLRIGTGLSGVDNFDNHGNLAAAINIKDGRAGECVNYFGERNITRHPQTNQVISGIRLPFWKNIKKLALFLADCCEGVNFVGWDIAITDKGPIVIEGNIAPDFVLIYQMTYNKWVNTKLFDKVISKNKRNVYCRNI